MAKAKSTKKASTTKSAPKKEMVIEETASLGQTMSKQLAKTHVYILEFFMMLFSLGALVVALINLFNSVISEGSSSSGVDDIGFLFDPTAALDTTLTMVALAVVSLPIFLVFFKRVRGSEMKSKAVFQIKRRLWLLYIFLGGLFFVGFIYGVSFIYSILQYLNNEATLTEHEEDLWRSLLKIAFALAVIKIVFYLLYSRASTAGMSSDKDGKNDKMFLTLVSVASVVLVIAQFFGPISREDNALIDSYIESDLVSIQSSLDQAFFSDNRLPAGLEEIELSAQQKKRASEFSYEYERRDFGTYTLCAEFKTDTRDREDEYFDFGYPLVTNLEDSLPYPEMPKVYKHREGRDCFEFSTGDFGPVPTFGDHFSEENPQPLPDILDLPENLNDESIQQLFDGLNAQ